MRSTLSVAPAGEPLTLAEAKKHLKVETAMTDDDLMITALIVAARGQAERVTQRQLITATWKAKYDRFPRDWRTPLTIPMPPLISVASVKYLDTDGVEQTWASSEYVVDAPAGPYAIEGRLYPGWNKEYPETCDRADALTITFDAGYGAAGAVPQPIKQAMYLMIGHWYENREAVNVGNIVNELPLGAEALLAPFQRLSALLR